MMISNTLKGLEDENETKIDCSLITKLLTILSILLIIFTILYFTCLGCFLVLNESTSRAAQTVTLSSEGPVNETDPHSMGEYQLAEEEIIAHNSDSSHTVSNWYQHVEREDRFLMYNSLGTMLSLINTGNPGMDTLLSTVDRRMSTVDRRVSKLRENI